MVRPLSFWTRAALWVGGLGWFVVVLTTTWLVARHDARMAVGFERWLVPMAVALVVATSGTAAHGLVATLARRAPGAAVSGVLLPLLAGASLVPALWTAPGRPMEEPTWYGTDTTMLITLDTFRADHVGVLGGKAHTPNLDALAASGAVFTQVVTPTPLTAPAHASMLTGSAPRTHGLVDNGRVVQRATNVGEYAYSYRTGAFLSSLVLDRRTGLDEGFHHYDDRFGWGQRLSFLPLVGALSGPGPIRRRGDETVARALQWLRQSPGSAFCWIHLYDPHAPYEPPPPFRPAVAADPGDPVAQRLLYQGAIEWTDALVGQVVGALSPTDTVIVVGDHGEGLGEHGQWFNHGAALYEPAVHVPMIVRAPAIAPGTVVDHLVSVAVVRDLLDQALLEAPGGSRISMFPAESVELYSTGQQQLGPRAAPAAGVRLDQAKLISDGSDIAYFDLAADPEELSPQPVPTGLDDHLDAIERALSDPVPALSEAEEKWLRVLGYLE